MDKTKFISKRSNSKDKLVLWALAEYPALKDTELSRKIGIKRRTFSVIKTKLKHNGMFSNIIVPDFNALGCEVLTISYGSFNPAVTLKDMKRGLKKITECEDIVHLYSTERDFVIMSASRNLTDFRRNVGEVFSYCRENDFLGDDVTSVNFPLEISNYNYFEFSSFIKKEFDIDAESMEKAGKVNYKKRLTRKEKIVLYTLLKMPDVKNETITAETGITTHTVGRIKKKLLQKGIIKMRKMPDLDVFGSELLSFMHVKYNHNTIEEYDQGTDFFKVDSGSDSVSLNLFKNYTEFKDYYNSKFESLKRNDLIDENPSVILFPIQKLMHVKDFAFAPQMKKILGV